MKKDFRKKNRAVADFAITANDNCFFPKKRLAMKVEARAAASVYLKPTR